MVRAATWLHFGSGGAARARAIVRATTHWQDAAEVLAASRGLGKAMPGLALDAIPENERLATRGW